MKRLDDSSLIALIKQNGNIGLDTMYRQYRDEFLSWGRGYFKADDYRLNDIYTDTCIAACHNVVSGKYSAIANTKFKSYLFEIAKNKHMNQVRSMKTDPLSKTVGDIFGSYEMKIEKADTSTVPESLPHYNKFVDEKDSEDIRRSKEAIVKDVVFNEMTEPCSKLFRYIYYENRKGKEIADLMSYSNADTVKSMALSGRKKLADTLYGKFRNAGLI